MAARRLSTRIMKERQASNRRKHSPGVSALASCVRGERAKSTVTHLFVCLGLAAVTCTVFGQTLAQDFVNFDDHLYVYENPRVIRGISTEGMIAAFTHTHARNWHPLTTVSHMLDCQLYGLNAGGHHLTNVILHTISVLLLFLVLKQMTGALWQSAFVAALFAIHPLHAESVAWIAERKDVLSAVFFMLTLAAYTSYTRAPSGLRYLLVALLFALGLMSKPMLVTLPFVLLLLDYWPLRRFDEPPIQDKPKSLKRGTKQKSSQQIKVKTTSSLIRTVDLIWEKAPLFLLTLAGCAVTVKAQKAGGALAHGEALGLGTRLANGVVAYSYPPIGA